MLEVVTARRILFVSPKVVQRPGSDSPLYFDSQNMYQIFMEKRNASARRLLPAALLESSAGRRFASPRSRLKYYRRIVSFPQQTIQ